MALVSIQYVLMAIGMIMASMDLESFDIESVPNCSLPPSSLHVSHTHFKHFAKAMELSTQKADVNELFANTTTTPFVCIDHCKTFITLEWVWHLNVSITRLLEKHIICPAMKTITIDVCVCVCEWVEKKVARKPKIWLANTILQSHSTRNASVRITFSASFLCTFLSPCDVIRALIWNCHSYNSIQSLDFPFARAKIKRNKIRPKMHSITGKTARWKGEKKTFNWHSFPAAHTIHVPKFMRCLQKDQST